MSTAAPDEPHDVRSLAVTYRSSHRLPPHAHGWAQLVYARSGVMHVTAEDHVWLVPSTRAAWVPAGVPHAIDFRGEVAMRTLYVAPPRARAVPAGVRTIEVAPLLAELVLHILGIGKLDPRRPEHDRLAGVLVDLVAAAPALDLALPLPRDGRAHRFAEALLAAPGERAGLEALAARCGASLRTVQRRFLDETGLPLDSWRQKARLIHAVGLLDAGSSVTQAAQGSGYDSASAFGAAFRAQFGAPPGRFRRQGLAATGARRAAAGGATMSGRAG